MHADEDKKAKESIETRNNADNLAYQCEKQLKDLGDKLDGAKKKEIEDAIEKVREALKGSDNDAIKSASDDLNTKFQAVSEELYKNAAAGAQTGPGPEASAGPEASEPNTKKADADVVDAEFEMVDEDKKK